jgi:hypothetical protein
MPGSGPRETDGRGGGEGAGGGAGRLGDAPGAAGAVGAVRVGEGPGSLTGRSMPGPPGRAFAPATRLARPPRAGGREPRAGPDPVARASFISPVSAGAAALASASTSPDAPGFSVAVVSDGEG